MEESNSDISDSSVDESDYDQVDAATGRANCTMRYKKHPTTRRNIHKNVPHERERAGVHVAVPTHSVSATLSFFFMDEKQELVIQATNHKGTSL